MLQRRAEQGVQKIEMEENTLVLFKVLDVFHPAPDELLRTIRADLVIQGRIIGFSDSGPHKNYFAIIKVAGLADPLIVRTESVSTVFKED